jgi:hypothetical protein
MVRRIKSRFQAMPAITLIPINFSFPFRGGGALRYSVPKWLLFLNVGSGFTACVVCSFSSSFMGEVLRIQRFGAKWH